MARLGSGLLKLVRVDTEWAARQAQHVVLQAQPLAAPGGLQRPSLVALAPFLTDQDTDDRFRSFISTLLDGHLAR